VQRLTHIVKTGRRAILGEHLLQIDLHPQEVAHGVLILDPVETAEHHPALGSPAVGFRSRDLAADPPRQRLDLRRRRARLRLRRHFARLDPLSYGQPAFQDVLIVEVRRKPIEAEVSLGLLRPVAFQAVPGQERPDLLVIPPDVRLVSPGNCHGTEEDHHSAQKLLEHCRSCRY
jgi:hypothetical protein